MTTEKITNFYTRRRGGAEMDWGEKETGITRRRRPKLEIRVTKQE